MNFGHFLERKVDYLLLGILALASFTVPSFSQTRPFENYYLATTIPFDDGRPYASVVGLFQDDHDFVWVCTYGGGLVRYDGSSKVLFSTKSRRRPLSSNYVTVVDQDDFNRLWVGGSEGIDLVDLKTLDILPLPEEIVYASRSFFCSTVKRSSDGCIWFNSNNELFRIAFDENGNVENLSHISCSDAKINLRFMVEDVAKDGSVWTIVNGKISSISYVEGKGLVITPLFPDLSFSEENFATAFLRDRDFLWLGTTVGLYKLNLTDKTYTEYRYDPEDADSISNNEITEIRKSRKGEILVATVKGLNVYDPSADGFTRYYADFRPNGERILSNDVIRAMLCVDDQLWIGTELAGVSVIRERLLGVTNVIHSDERPNGIPSAPVLDVFFDSKGKFWLSSDGVGLCISKGSLQFDILNTRNSALFHNTITSMAEDKHGRVWLSCTDGHLNYTSVDSPSSVGRPIGYDSEVARRIDYISDLSYDPINDYVWICSRSGLFYYDIPSSRFVEYEYPLTYCVCSYIDAEGRLWIGHKNGVLTLDLKSNRNINHKEAGYCTSVLIDSHNNLWLGTREGGLYKTQPNPWGGMTLELFKSENGLADDRIRSLIESAGYVWAATERGLSRINIGTGEVASFYAEDGLVCPTFSENAISGTPNGYVCIGHKEGVTFIDARDTNNAIKQKSVIRFTRVTAEKTNVNLMYDKSVRMHERERGVVFEFADMSFSTDKDVVYYTRLYPMEKEWRQIYGNGRYIRYARLPGGHYKIQVRSMDRNGNVLSEDVRDIDVKPYFHKTAVFYVLLFLLILGLVYLFIQYRTMSLERKRQMLQQEVDKQTALLNKQKQELASRAEELSEQNERLLKQNETLVSQRMLFATGVTLDNTSEESRFADKFMAKIRELYKDPDIDVETIAEAMGMSRSGLNNKVQEAFSQSIGQFVRTYRLNVAKEIIANGRTGSMNVSEIAYEVGFNDPKYFTRCFSKEFGMSPSVMINGHQSEE